MISLLIYFTLNFSTSCVDKLKHLDLSTHDVENTKKLFEISGKYLIVTNKPITSAEKLHRKTQKHEFSKFQDGQKIIEEKESFVDYGNFAALSAEETGSQDKIRALFELIGNISKENGIKNVLIDYEVVKSMTSECKELVQSFMSPTSGDILVKFFISN